MSNVFVWILLIVFLAFAVYEGVTLILQIRKKYGKKKKLKDTEKTAKTDSVIDGTEEEER